MRPAHLIVYSDYLCPWCYNASVRLHRLEEEFGSDLHLEWRAFLLRPQNRERRNLEKFRAYTQSWLVPAAEPDSGLFQVWSSAAGPPGYSVPPHLLAKAAAAIGTDAFRAVHQSLLRAYFTDNRDITDRDTMLAIWLENDLPRAGFDRIEDPAIEQAVLEEHREAMRIGITGAPSIRAADNDTAALGAFPMETYRRWVQRLLAA